MSVAQRGSDAGERHHSSRRWLREASLQRLNMFMRNKTEMIGNAAQLGMGVISMEGLEQSGLSASEIFHLRQWIAGLITGRQCMFALLDCRNSGKEESGAVESAVSYQNLKPSEYVRSAMDLPDNFLCDSGYLYNTIFSRPQTAVVREALVMLSKKAFEKSPATLDIEQINIAIKQLKLDNLGGKGASDDEKLDGESQQPSEEGEKNNQTTNEQNFRLQILVELIRSHIIHHCRDGEKLFAREMEDDGTSESDSVKYPLYTEYKQKKSKETSTHTSHSFTTILQYLSFVLV